MNRFLRAFAPLIAGLACLASLLPATSARADFAFTLGSGATAFSFTSTTGGTAICAAASTHCFASVPIDKAGAQLFTSGNAGYVQFPSAQAVTLASTTITGTVAATQSGTWNVNNIAGTISLPTGAATAANQASAITLLTSINTNVQAGTGAFGSAYPATGIAPGLYDGTNLVRPKGDETNGAWVNVKTSVLPTGASTAAKQPALGTAGTASTDVLSVQGIASMTPLLANPGTAANWGVGVTGSSIPANAGLGGCTGINAEQTAVTNGQLTSVACGLGGKQIMLPYAVKELYVKGTTAAMTGTTSTQLIAAVTSNKIYLTDLTCGNSHATVGTFVNVQDGSGGTTIWTVPAAAVYGGATKNFNIPIATTAGNGVFVADATTGANVICSGAGYSGL